MRPRALVAVAVAALVALVPSPSLASSSDDLVQQAREHEAANDDAVAVRRYVEALAIEPTHAGAWMGLGALRMRTGDPVEAERVYDAALSRIPALRPALRGRAEARWAQGRRAEAEADLEEFATLTADLGALRELASWFASEGRAPSQLNVWRRILALARGDDRNLEAEARRMVRALVVLVDPADPASFPTDADATRRAMASVARRGG